ncbi:hypothetical protein DNTS_004991, partial [Danionella cerebrum]
IFSPMHQPFLNVYTISGLFTDDAGFDVCLGLQTLLELKCCVDLNSRALRLHRSEQELPFLDPAACSQCHHHDNNNKNM